MTRKEWVKEHFPDAVGAECAGGVADCPYRYEGLTELDANLNECDCNNYENCTDCWNAEINFTNDEIKPADDEIESVKVEREEAEAEQTIKDSGNRREFSTGAVRDMAEGKGRCDLMPLDIVANYMDDSFIGWIATFMRTRDLKCLLHALNIFCNEQYNGSKVTMLLEVAKHFEDGAKKYGENNWQKGLPVECYIDSALRHYLKWMRGDTDEPHDRAAVWNIICCAWTVKHKGDAE